MDGREGATTVWRLSGTIKNALCVKNVRLRLYRNADKFLGYYEEGKEAFYYEEDGNTLKINVLFEIKDDALRLDSHIHDSSAVLTFNVSVTSSATAQLGKRIHFQDYIPTDSELNEPPAEIPTKFPLVDQMSDQFKYQRIERLSVFGSQGKAEICPWMSTSTTHCGMYSPAFDNDSKNRLAMSRDLNGWFNALSSLIPLFYLKIVSISNSTVVAGRHKVVLAVVAYNQESADMIFRRLIEHSTKTDDPLVMHTFVHVTNPVAFQKCLEWKEKRTLQIWDDYDSISCAFP